MYVSTHSRLKAAGCETGNYPDLSTSFNTQPPKGGWLLPTTPARRGETVSTHSRLKAAGFFVTLIHLIAHVSTHSRLKAAGSAQMDEAGADKVSTHSRLKAAGKTN